MRRRTMQAMGLGLLGGMLTLGLSMPAVAEEGTLQEVASETHLDDGAGEGLTIGFCPMDLSNPFFALMRKSADEEASRLGVTLDVQDGKSDASVQVTAMENFISKGVDAIYVVPVDTESLKDAIQEAEDAGIPVITHTSQYDNATAFLAIDETDMGETLGNACGEWMEETFGSDAAVEYAVLTQSTLPQTIGRSNGIQDGIAAHMPNAVCVDLVDAWLPDMGMEAAETLLLAHPDLVAICGINDSGALGAFEVAKAADVGEDFFIGGVDGGEEAVTNIKNGTIYRASVDIGPIPTGQLAVDYGVMLAHGESVPAVTPIEVSAITIANAQEIYDDRFAK